MCPTTFPRYVNSIRRDNRPTILFVSHDPSSVRALCNRAVLLNQGQKIAEGTPSDVLNRYQKIIMARQQAYEASSTKTTDQPGEVVERKTTPLS